MDFRWLAVGVLSFSTALPLAAEGVLPLPGKWVQGPCSATSKLELDGNKVTGMNVIPRKNLKFTRYSADKVIEPVAGDFAATARLQYECKDKLFLGAVYFQLVDANNKVLAHVGMIDGWEKVSGRIAAGISGSKASPKRQDLPYNGVLSLEIIRQKNKYTVSVNGSPVITGDGADAPVHRIRLVYQSDKRPGAHFGAFEFADIAVKPLAADAPARFSVFDESPKGGFSGAWVAVRELNTNGLIVEDEAAGMTIAGFKNVNDKVPNKSAQYMLRRNVPAAAGDFSALLDMAWDLPADRRFMGMANIQLVNAKNQVIASGGITDGWIGGAARLSGSIGKEYFKERADVADVGGMTFRIERRNGAVTVYAGARQLMSLNDVKDAVTSVRVLFGQNFYRDSAGNNLSKPGRITVKRVAFDAPAQP